MSKPGKVLKGLCKRLGVRLTVERGKKRVYKSVKVLKAQCKRKKKKKVKKKRKVKIKRTNKFGYILRSYKKKPLTEKEIKRMKYISKNLKTKKDLTRLAFCFDRIGLKDRFGKSLLTEKCIDFIAKNTKNSRKEIEFIDKNMNYLVLPIIILAPLLGISIGMGAVKLYEYLKEKWEIRMAPHYYSEIRALYNQESQAVRDFERNIEGTALAELAENDLAFLNEVNNQYWTLHNMRADRLPLTEFENQINRIVYNRVNRQDIRSRALILLLNSPDRFERRVNIVRRDYTDMTERGNPD